VGRGREGHGGEGRDGVARVSCDTSIGIIVPQFGVHETRYSCLPSIAPLWPSKIRNIREQSRVSQAVFATLLDTSIPTIQKSEIGQKRPSGTALKLLYLVRKCGLEAVA
jgi:putative transcriptional regulator